MAIIPVYAEEDLRTGAINWGLTVQDFEKVRQGYGCPKCLEDFNGVWLMTCPVCGHQRNEPTDFIPTPDHMRPGVAAPAPEQQL